MFAGDLVFPRKKQTTNNSVTSQNRVKQNCFNLATWVR